MDDSGADYWESVSIVDEDKESKEILMENDRD